MSAAPCPRGRRLGTEPLGHEGPRSLHCQLPERCPSEWEPAAHGHLVATAPAPPVPAGVQSQPGESPRSPAGLQEAVAYASAHGLSVYLLGPCSLWCGSLQLGGGLTLTLSRKLCVEVLLPVQQALWQPLTITWARGLQLLATLVHRAQRGIPRLLQWEAGLALLPVAQWSCCSPVSSRQENGKALEQLLRAALQQVAVSLLVCCLDRLRGALRQGHMRCSGLQPLERARLCWAASKDLDAVTSILPAPAVPFSRRFPRPGPATLSRLSAASIRLCLAAGASKGEGGCRFGTTKLPISSRFQSNRTSKMAVGASPKQALARQVKVTCVLIILLYVCAASLLVQILK